MNPDNLKVPITASNASSPEDPAHYQRGNIQVWDFIADQGLDFFTGNVVKYVCRAGYKDDKVQDLKKAKAYIDKLIDLCS